MITEQEFVDKSIDWDRGVTSRNHKKSGIWINMYKDEPGVFYDMRGGLIPDILAREAGFDVGNLKKAAERKKRLDSAIESVDQEFSSANPREVLFERGDYKVIASSPGYADIYDIDGNHMNTVKMKRKDAVSLAEKMTAEVRDEVPETA